MYRNQLRSEMHMESLEKVERLKAKLNDLRPITAEMEARIMQKFRLDWNYHSNKIEGNSLTFGETKALILFGLTANGKPLKDHFEITGHDEAIKWIEEIVKDETPLTETFIRQLHTLLLKESYEVDALTPDGKPTRRRIEVGRYKTMPNHVLTRTGEIFYFAQPEETAAKMQDLIEWFRAKKELAETNGVLLAAEFHYKFIRIHPFDDGNGRVARLLMNFILMQNGYPPVIIKTDDKENYFNALQQADAGIFEPFLNYIANNLIRSLEIMIRGAKGESIEEPDDLDKELTLLEKRINSLEQPAQIICNDEIIKTIVDEVVIPFTYELIKHCRKFDKFYLRKIITLKVEPDHYWKSYEDNTLESVKELAIIADSKSITIIDISYKHQEFSYYDFGSFDFISNLEVVFQTYKYVLKIQGFAVLFSEKIERGYSEIPSFEELNDSLNKLSKAHKNYIEEHLLSKDF